MWHCGKVDCRLNLANLAEEQGVQSWRLETTHGSKKDQRAEKILVGDQQCKVAEDEAGGSVCQIKYHTPAQRRSYLQNPDDTAQWEEKDENSTADVWRCLHVVGGQEE